MSDAAQAPRVYGSKGPPPWYGVIEQAKKKLENLSSSERAKLWRKRRGEGKNKMVGVLVSPATWKKARVLADQPRSKRKPEWFLGVGQVVATLQNQFGSPVIPDEAKGLYQVVNGPTIAVHVKQRKSETYRIPAATLASVHVVVVVEGVREDDFVAKRVWLCGVISQQRMRGTYQVRKDNHYHVSANRLDSMTWFGQWCRECQSKPI